MTTATAAAPSTVAGEPGEPEIPPPHRPDPGVPITHPLPDAPTTPLLPETPGDPPEVPPPTPQPARS